LGETNPDQEVSGVGIVVRRGTLKGIARKTEIERGKAKKMILYMSRAVN